VLLTQLKITTNNTMPAPPPPPPPPTPPPPPPQNGDATAANSGGGIGGAAAALFAEIRDGGDNITARLRHVTDDEKAYKKNIQHGEIDMSELEKKKAAAEARRAAQRKDESAANEAPAQEPILELEGDKRWTVRYHTGTSEEQLQLELDKVEMRHAVRIENCQHVYITLANKVNSVSIVNCSKVQVALQTIVASLEVLNCTNCDVQVAQAAPTVAVERSSSINIYLLDREEARNTEVVTACSSAVNVLFPSENDDDDVVERAIPEQFVSRIVPDGKGGFKVETKPSESF
jgi:hypothetical protein